LKKIVMNRNMMDADRQDVLAFLSGSSDYAPASGEITGILKTMGDEMSADLKDAVAKEEEAVAAYEELMAAKKKEVNALTKMIEEKLTRIGDLGVEIQQMKNDLGDTGESLVEDKKFLADLDKNCDEKQKLYEENVKYRTQELAAPDLGTSQRATIDNTDTVDMTPIDGWLAANEARLISQLNGTHPAARGKTTELATVGGTTIHSESHQAGQTILPPSFRLQGGYNPSILSTVKRRSDTSYVFCTEVQFISAVAAADGRPRISLVMLASKLGNHEANGTAGMSLLKVDCLVEKTEVIPLVTRHNSMTNETSLVAAQVL